MTTSSMTAIPMAVGALRLMTLGPVAQMNGVMDWWGLIEKGGTIAVLAIFCYMLYRNDQASRRKFDRQQELIIKALTQSTKALEDSARATEYCIKRNLANNAREDANRGREDANRNREDENRERENR